MGKAYQPPFSFREGGVFREANRELSEISAESRFAPSTEISEVGSR